MNEIQLNLARKWRAQYFDQIIGQPLSVKMLKNSLFKNHLFPVYLFWGQRGTGKTSMARVFAAAINCEALPLFQKDPKNNPVPCLTCNSCKAMAAGKHPDFTEIDAASHTGVDNIRQIIDSAAFLPLMGHKKIYLVDEAHMLSKAAFNALLKILEEPPVSAFFILATTDQQKIIDTVRSRCFQVYFKPVDTPEIVNHLTTICSQESIYADKDALLLIAHESEGSIRDAINILERVRFSQGRITSAAVLSVLGHVDDRCIIKILELICRHDAVQLMNILHNLHVEQLDADYIWKRLGELLRMLVWARYNLPISLVHENADMLLRIAKTCPIVTVTEMLQLLYSHERLFAKTTNKHLLLEMLFLKMCQRGNSNNEPTMNPIAQQTACAVSTASNQDDCDDDTVEDDQEDTHDDYPEVDTASSAVDKKIPAKNWQAFVNKIEIGEDPLLISVFKNGFFKNFDQEKARVDVAFAQQFVFFQDWLANSKADWKPRLDDSFGCVVTLNAIFTQEIEPVVTAPSERQPTPKIVKDQAREQQPPAKQPFKPFVRGQKTWASPAIAKKPVVDVSNEALWPKATLLLKHFPGRVCEQ